MFVVQISLFIVTFNSLISRNLSLMQATQEVNPHPHIASSVNMWSVFFFFFFFFFFLCHLLNVGACVCHVTWEGQVERTSVGDRRTNSNCPHIISHLFHIVTCYTDSILSCIHFNTTKLRNITYTLVATSVILQSLECILLHILYVMSSYHTYESYWKVDCWNDVSIYKGIPRH
jgi:hypothetical protein